MGFYWLPRHVPFKMAMKYFESLGFTIFIHNCWTEMLARSPEPLVWPPTVIVSILNGCHARTVTSTCRPRSSWSTTWSATWRPRRKKYICEKCGKRFGWSHHLAKHEMNVHVRSRPYKCSVQGCNWAFNDLSNRYMHERRVHKLGPPPKRWYWFKKKANYGLAC
jgi:hypothetical protein